MYHLLLSRLVSLHVNINSAPNVFSACPRYFPSIFKKQSSCPICRQQFTEILTSRRKIEVKPIVNLSLRHSRRNAPQMSMNMIFVPMPILNYPWSLNGYMMQQPFFYTPSQLSGPLFPPYFNTLPNQLSN
jgi:hypothetical protein